MGTVPVAHCGKMEDAKGERTEPTIVFRLLCDPQLPPVVPLRDELRGTLGAWKPSVYWQGPVGPLGLDVSRGHSRDQSPRASSGQLGRWTRLALSLATSLRSGSS